MSIAEITARLSFTRFTRAEDAEEVANVLRALKAAILDEGDLTIVGFGRFTVKTRPAHKGRNPRSGEPLDLPEMRVLTFSPSRTWRAKLNP